MIHLKFTRRLHQTRGSSMLSGVLMRISALKEYEDAELTAARIAAALGLYIRKGDGQGYEDPGIKETEREVQSPRGLFMTICAGARISAWSNPIVPIPTLKLSATASCVQWQLAVV
ncbi:phage portal protein [Escherichia coli]